MNPNETLTEDQFLWIFIAATAAVALVCLIGFWFFLRWSKRDRMKRNNQVRRVTGRGLDD